MNVTMILGRAETRRVLAGLIAALAAGALVVLGLAVYQVSNAGEASMNFSVSGASHVFPLSHGSAGRLSVAKIRVSVERDHLSATAWWIWVLGRQLGNLTVIAAFLFLASVAVKLMRGRTFGRFVTFTLICLSALAAWIAVAVPALHTWLQYRLADAVDAPTSGSGWHLVVDPFAPHWNFLAVAIVFAVAAAAFGIGRRAEDDTEGLV